MKKEKRNLFQKIFGTSKNIVYGTSMQMLNNYTASFSSIGDNIYNSPTARSCIDAIARNGAKLSPKLIRYDKDKNLTTLNTKIQKLISERPNDYMNAFDFYYKMISLLYVDNNAFVWIERDTNGTPLALHPIKAGSYSVVEYKNNVFLQFDFLTGKSYTASFDDLIHLKRYFCQNDVLGGSNNPIKTTLETYNTTKDGIVNAIKTTAGIKGILKTTQAMLKPEDIKKARDEFVRDFVDSDNSSGIAGIDAKTEFQEVKIEPTTATADQMNDIKGEIYDYFGLSSKIVRSEYSEDEWNAFYESVLEPIAVQMSMEFTYKVLTPGQRGFGNKIVFEAQRLQYASNKTKINIARYLNNYFTINEIREIFNMAPTEDGDKILQDLNHIDSDIANDYQKGDQENE